MKHISNSKRSRDNRYNGKRSHFHGRSSTIESSGPDVKVRGTAHQVLEKYQALARDAVVAGDPIAAENFLQHAEHYHRLVAASMPDRPRERAPDIGEKAADEPVSESATA